MPEIPVFYCRNHREINVFTQNTGFPPHWLPCGRAPKFDIRRGLGARGSFMSYVQFERCAWATTWLGFCCRRAGDGSLDAVIVTAAWDPSSLSTSTRAVSKLGPRARRQGRPIRRPAKWWVGQGVCARVNGHEVLVACQCPLNSRGDRAAREKQQGERVRAREKANRTQ